MPADRVAQVNALLAGEPVPAVTRNSRGSRKKAKLGPAEAAQPSSPALEAAPAEAGVTALGDARRRFKLTQQEMIDQLAEAGDAPPPNRRAYCGWEAGKRPMPQWARVALADLQQNGLFDLDDDPPKSGSLPLRRQGEGEAWTHRRIAFGLGCAAAVVGTVFWLARKGGIKA